MVIGSPAGTMLQRGDEVLDGKSDRRTSRSIIFISHSSQDTWIAQQIAKGVEAAGAETFVDANDIALGDEDFEERIREALNRCSELIVLLTPESVTRPYLWLEVGSAWSQKKRVSAILYRMTPEELRRETGAPVLLLKGNLTILNDMDKFKATARASAARMIMMGIGNEGSKRQT